MKLIIHTINGFRYGWPLDESLAYFINGISQGLGVFPSFFSRIYNRIAKRRFVPKIQKLASELVKKIEESGMDINTDILKNIIINPPIWKKDKSYGKYIDLDGIKIHESSITGEFIDGVFSDSLLIYYFFQDNYKKEVLQLTESVMSDGAYGYTDGRFDVSVKSGDVVIDAGAYTGDFAAYASAKNAITYAFEPAQDTYNKLVKTANLNKDTIIPIPLGLSNELGEIILHGSGGGASFISTKGVKKEKIQLTTIDKFVEENKITNVNFIKADVEGAERNMLLGATKVLQIFAPKLAISTYHLPDDPEVLEKIILEANPNYTIIQTRKKLFAVVID